MRHVSTKTSGKTLTDRVVESPVERSQRMFRWKFVAILLLAILLLSAFRLVRRFSRDSTAHFNQPAEHFKYGSIGGEPGGSIFSPVGGVLPPEAIFAVLPDMFPERLPGGYASLGLLYEPGHDLPIGISKRNRFGQQLAGLNCAVCHVGTFRTSDDASPQIVLGMPAHQLDLQRLFLFTLDSILDPRFTADSVQAAIESRFGPLDLVDRTALRKVVVPQLRETSASFRERVGHLLSPTLPRWGPGRVDTFNPYKALQFNWPLDRLPAGELSAACDFPAVWNQEIRRDMQLHWDGNNNSLAERNLSAGLGAGITPVTADHPAIERVAIFLLNLPPPAWPAELPLDRAKAAAGREHYRQHCAACHDVSGEKIGTVEPWPNIRTDRQRLDSYTIKFADNQNLLFADTPYRFNHFRKTNGYSNQPLDGLWARAPYLHNGSVPTLADLLEPSANRPQRFFRGCDLYDPVRVGFVSDRPRGQGREYVLYDTSLLGNSNSGHEYGTTELSAPQKLELLEYLKTL